MKRSFRQLRLEIVYLSSRWLGETNDNLRDYGEEKSRCTFQHCLPSSFALQLFLLSPSGFQLQTIVTKKTLQFHLELRDKNIKLNCS